MDIFIVMGWPTQFRDLCACALDVSRLSRHIIRKQCNQLYLVPHIYLILQGSKGERGNKGSSVHIRGNAMTGAGVIEGPPGPPGPIGPPGKKASHGG